MENTTIYTIDLMVEFNYATTSKMRKANLICSIICAIFIASLIVCSFIFDEYFILFSIVYVLLAIILIFTFSVYKSTTKSGLKKNMEKQTKGNAEVVNYYNFEEDGFTIKSIVSGSESFSRVEYSFIKKIVKASNEVMYLYNNQNQVYIVQDKQGIDNLFQYLSEKLRQKEEIKE